MKFADELGRGPLEDRARRRPPARPGPRFITAIRSLIVSASSWSCVTKTNVMPSSRCRCLSCDLHLLAQLLVERAERLVEQQHLGLEGQGAGERDALALAARELRRAARFSKPESCTSAEGLGDAPALRRARSTPL